MQTLQYSERLIRHAIARAILRLLGPVFFIVLALLAGQTAFSISRGERGWLLGVETTIVALGIILPLAAIRAHTNVALRKLAGMDGKTGQIELSSTELHLSSSLGTMSLPLSTITSVWCYPEYWVLLSGKSILMTLPLVGIPAETTAAWLAHLRGAGVAVA